MTIIINTYPCSDRRSQNRRIRIKSPLSLRRNILRYRTAFSHCRNQRGFIPSQRSWSGWYCFCGWRFTCWCFESDVVFSSKGNGRKDFETGGYSDYVECCWIFCEFRYSNPYPLPLPPFFYLFRYIFGLTDSVCCWWGGWDVKIGAGYTNEEGLKVAVSSQELAPTNNPALFNSYVTCAGHPAAGCDFGGIESSQCTRRKGAFSLDLSSQYMLTVFAIF